MSGWSFGGCGEMNNVCVFWERWEYGDESGVGVLTGVQGDSANK